MGLCMEIPIPLVLGSACPKYHSKETFIVHNGTIDGNDALLITFKRMYLKDF